MLFSLCNQKHTVKTKLARYTLQNNYINAIKTRLASIENQPQQLASRIEIATSIAELLLQASIEEQSHSEKREEKRISKMLSSLTTKALACQVIDSCFRTKTPQRLIDHLLYLIESHTQKKCGSLLKTITKWFATPLVALMQCIVAGQMKHVILPGEKKPLNKQLQKLHKQSARINVNRLGEAILGDHEAKNRMESILEDIQNPLIWCVSVKITSIYSHVHPLAVEHCLNELKKHFRTLLDCSMLHKKMIYLDMEEYKDMELTVRLFQEVLSEPEYATAHCGIALQSYLPDAFFYQQQLTKWALETRSTPIAIRLVKGANLGMERVEASTKQWPQAPFKTKAETDQNFKKMLHYGLKSEHVKIVHIGVASHNLFDISYAMVLRAENAVTDSVCFEMLCGMAPHIARTVQKITNNVLLYCPAAKKEEFYTAIAYLMRRLDEHSTNDNFLSHLFSLKVDSEAWIEQKERFIHSCLYADSITLPARRTQDRFEEHYSEIYSIPDTDWSLPKNVLWGQSIISEWQSAFHEIPLVIDGQELYTTQRIQGIDPSAPQRKIHSCSIATKEIASLAVESAVHDAKTWSQTSLKERIFLFKQVAFILQKERKTLIGCMMQEAAKPLQEADTEVSEAIDFALYYADILQHEHFGSQAFNANKVALIATPWNFPVAIATSGIISALASGHTVLFKPAPEAILSGWNLAQLLWKAGIPKKSLQFIVCPDEPVGSYLIQDSRIDKVILTGSTATAEHFLKLRPTMQLFAETGGKNAIIVSALSDRDLAVRSIIASSFGYAGQKCSACSLLILEEEVYYDKGFKQQLFDAASSLITGPVWNSATELPPLIRPAAPHLHKAMTQLEFDEQWLVRPKQDIVNPHLWSCGIVYDVKPGSWRHMTEFFGPILSVLPAKTVKHATELANMTAYGLTAGLHSLDPREHKQWLSTITAGNCYINRTTTGAIVGRQPFGGCKASSFGIGMKAGGPNYILQLLEQQKSFGNEVTDVDHWLHLSYSCLLQPGEQREFTSALHSYTLWWQQYFSRTHELEKIVGQDNYLSFTAKENFFVLFHDSDSLLDCLLIMAACKITGCKALFGLEQEMMQKLASYCVACSFDEVIEVIKKTPHPYIRSLQPPKQVITPFSFSCLDMKKPSRHGRLELLHYVRELAVCTDYHRYGNLMDRESDIRKPLL